MKKILSVILSLVMLFSVASFGSITVSAAIGDGVLWEEVLNIDFDEESTDSDYYGNFYEATSGNCYVGGTESKVNDPGTGYVYRVASTNGYTSLNLKSGAKPVNASKVRIEVDLAKDNTTEDFFINLIGSVDGETVTTTQSSPKRFVFQSGDKFYFDNGDYRWDGPKYVAKEWYNVRMDIDCEIGKYDVYIDGELLCDGNELPYDFDAICGISFTARKKNNTNRAYFDNVKYSIPVEDVEVVTSSVTLNTNGGTIVEGNITEYREGRITKLPTDVTKSGYVFGGWYDNANFTGTAVTEIPATATGDKTYYAKWLRTYSVTLNTNGGTIYSGNVTSYAEGIGATLPTDVTKSEGYFAGWYDNSALSGTAVTEIPATATGNKTYYAKYTKWPAPGKGPIIILKFDDLNSTGAVDKFRLAFDIVKEKGVKCGMGVVCSFLEDDQEDADELAAGIKEFYSEGAEIWSHGYKHLAAEYGSDSYEQQKESFGKALSVMKRKCGIDITSFGAPENQSTTDTVRMINENYPQIKTLMLVEDTEHIAIPEVVTVRANIEPSTGVFDFEHFKTQYELVKSAKAIVLQGHPHQWDDNERKQLEQTIDYLKADGAIFMTPTEYAEYREATDGREQWKKLWHLNFETENVWKDYFETTAPNDMKERMTDFKDTANEEQGKWSMSVRSTSGIQDLSLIAKNSPLYYKNNDKVRIEFDFVKENTTENFWINLVGKVDGEVTQTTRNYAERFIFMYKDKIYFDNDTERWEGPSYLEKTWYKITVDIDCENRLYDVYINDRLQCEGNRLAFAFDEIYGVSFTSEKSGSIEYNEPIIDNIRYYTVAGADEDIYSDVTLNSNGGTINSGNITKYIEGVGATLPVDVTRDGYTFCGWYDNASFNGENIRTVPASATGNMTYYAKWEKIIFVGEGVEWEEVLFEDFEDSSWKTYIDESGDSGQLTFNDKDGGNKDLSVYLTNGYDMGSTFKRIAQGKSVTSDRYIYTKPEVITDRFSEGADIIKIKFNVARSSEWTDTNFSIIGNTNDGAASETMLAMRSNVSFCIYDENDKEIIGPECASRNWYEIMLIADASTDTFDVYCDGVIMYNGLPLSNDFTGFTSFEIRTLKQSASKTYETFVDNLSLSIDGNSGMGNKVAFFTSNSSDNNLVVNSKEEMSDLTLFVAAYKAGEMTDIIVQKDVELLKGINNFPVEHQWGWDDRDTVKAFLVSSSTLAPVTEKKTFEFTEYDLTSNIGANGNWWVNGYDTQIPASTFACFRTNPINYYLEVSYDGKKTWESLDYRFDHSAVTEYDFPLEKREILPGTIVDSDNRFKEMANYRGSVIYVEDSVFDTVTITRGTEDIGYAFLAAKPEYFYEKDKFPKGYSPSYAAGYTRVVYSDEEQITLEIPDNARYLYLYNNSENVSYIPSAVKFTKSGNPNVEDNNSVRVATWNIGHYSLGVNTFSKATEEKTAEFNDYIYNVLDADVIALNEYSEYFIKDSKKAKDTIFKNYPISFEGEQRKYSCNALYAMENVSNIEMHEFECNKTADMESSAVEADNYYYITADLMVNGKLVKLVSAHLAFYDGDKVPAPTIETDQMEELIEVCKGYDRVVMMGDWNCSYSDFATFTKAGYSLANTDSNLSTYSAGSGSYDNIMCKGVTISDFGLAGTKLSDHYAVYCTITVD